MSEFAIRTFFATQAPAGGPAPRAAGGPAPPGAGPSARSAGPPVLGSGTLLCASCPVQTGTGDIVSGSSPARAPLPPCLPGRYFKQGSCGLSQSGKICRFAHDLSGMGATWDNRSRWAEPPHRDGPARTCKLRQGHGKSKGGADVGIPRGEGGPPWVGASEAVWQSFTRTNDAVKQASSRPDALATLLRQLAEEERELDGVNVATILHRSAKLGARASRATTASPLVPSAKAWLRRYPRDDAPAVGRPELLAAPQRLAARRPTS